MKIILTADLAEVGVGGWNLPGQDEVSEGAQESAEERFLADLDVHPFGEGLGKGGIDHRPAPDLGPNRHTGGWHQVTHGRSHEERPERADPEEADGSVEPGDSGCRAEGRRVDRSQHLSREYGVKCDRTGDVRD